jgi:hypothetical protein
MMRGVMVFWIALLSACKGAAPCIEEHQIFSVYPQWIDKQVIMIPQTYSVCDKRIPERLK